MPPNCSNQLPQFGGPISVGANRMFGDIFSPLLEALKLAPRYFVVAGVLAAFLLFAPSEFLKQIALNEFAQNYRTVLGLVFAGSVALLSVTGVIALGKSIASWWRSRRGYRRVIERLNSLTEDEKQILRFYVAQQTKTNTLRVDDGVVQGLVASGIIFRAAAVGNILEGFSHNISDFAWNYLNVYPHVLEGTTNTYRTDRRESFWR